MSATTNKKTAQGMHPQEGNKAKRPDAVPHGGPKVPQKAAPGTTKRIIAQRISSVMDADRIIVINDGKVDGFDTHENLLKNNEIYRDVYDSQTNGGGDFDEGGAA